MICLLQPVLSIYVSKNLRLCGPPKLAMRPAGHTLPTPDSGAASLSNINNDAIAGIDTSRYTADITGLTVTTDRPGIRLTITDYQASDGATDFSCQSTS